MRKNIQHTVTDTVHARRTEQCSCDKKTLCGISSVTMAGFVVTTDDDVSCGNCLRILGKHKQFGNMTDAAMSREAKRRKFFYQDSTYEVFHPSKPKKTLARVELHFEAEEYIGRVAKVSGLVYAGQLLIRKIIIDNPRGSKNKDCFVQWIKPVSAIELVIQTSYSVTIGR